MITPTRYPLVIRIGRSFRQKLTIRDKVTGLGIDLTGYSFKSEIREKQDASSTLIASFIIDDTESASGVLYLTLGETTIDGITADNGHYDVVLQDPSSNEDTYVYGTVKFKKGSTARPV